MDTSFNFRVKLKCKVVTYGIINVIIVSGEFKNLNYLKSWDNCQSINNWAFLSFCYFPFSTADFLIKSLCIRIDLEVLIIKIVWDLIVASIELFML